MKQVRLRTTPQYRLVRRYCARLRLFERNRFHPHCTQASQQKCRAEPLAGDLAVYLLGRLFDAYVIEQSRKLLVPDATAQHLRLYQLLRGVLPRLIGLSTHFWQSVHHLLTDFQVELPDSTGPSSRKILGRIRLIANRRHYTSSERTFCEDSLPRIPPTDGVGSPLSVPEGAL